MKIRQSRPLLPIILTAVLLLSGCLKEKPAEEEVSFEAEAAQSVSDDQQTDMFRRLRYRLSRCLRIPARPA